MDYDKHYINGRRKSYDELIASMGTSPEKIVFSLNERISELEKDKKIYETFMKKLYIYYNSYNCCYFSSGTLSLSNNIKF